jgi:hypothetical protein
MEELIEIVLFQQFDVAAVAYRKDHTTCLRQLYDNRIILFLRPRGYGQYSDHDDQSYFFHN